MISIPRLAAELERRTLEAHVSTRWELEASERLLEALLQSIKRPLGILLVIFLPVKDLYDEIVEFHEDRHDRYYICQFLTRV